MTDQDLMELAKDVRRHSYSPYSNFSVGAALLCSDGAAFAGCNIENASYPAGMCAERAAVARAVAEGHRDFVAIAISGGESLIGKIRVPDSEAACPPCGICRQVLREFSNPKEFKVILEDGTYTLEELLPKSFGPEFMDVKF